MAQDLEMLVCPLREGKGEVMPRRTFDLCCTEYFVIAAGEPELRASAALLDDWSDEQKQGLFAGPAPAGAPLPVVDTPHDDGEQPLMIVVQNRSALPRARIVRQAAVVPSASKRDWGRWIDLLKRIAFPNPAVPDLVRGVLIEGTANGPLFPPARQGIVPPDSDMCRLVTDAPNRVVLEADLVSPGMVVLADSWHPDWSVTVSSDGGPPRPEPMLRANRIHRAVSLPAGRHVLEFRHHSRTFAWTATVTLAAWAAAAVALVMSLRRRQAKSRQAAA